MAKIAKNDLLISKFLGKFLFQGLRRIHQVAYLLPILFLKNPLCKILVL